MAGRVYQLCLSHVRARRHRAVPADRPAGATDPIEPALRLLADVDAPDSFSRFPLVERWSWAVSGAGEVANDAAVDGDRRRAFTSYVCLMRAREAPSSGASRPTRRCD